MLDTVALIHMNGRVYDPRLGRFLSADPFVQFPSHTQSFNRYAYVLNNPLGYIDPSGYLSFKDAVKITFVVVAAAYTGGAAWAAATQVGGWATTTAVLGGTTVSYLSVGGAFAAGAIAGATAGFVSGALLSGTLKGAARGAFTGAVFGGIGGYYGDVWNASRIATTSFAGGVTTKASGGSFEEGFKLSLVTSMMQAGWQYTRQITNKHKYTACKNSDSICARNQWGELLTDGRRVPIDESLRRGEQPSKYLTKIGMAEEGTRHIYSTDSYVGRYVNWVSKTHDWMNSDLSKVFGFEGYSPITGRWLTKSTFHDLTFQIYNAVGMLPAGLYTAGAMSAYLPVGYFDTVWEEEDF